MIRILRVFAWGLAAICILGAVVARVRVGDLLQDQPTIIYVLDVGAIVLGAMALSGAFALLAAIIPWRKQKFFDRLWSRVPFSFAAASIAALVYATSPFWYPVVMDMEQQVGVDFDRIPTADSTACACVHDGIFENKGIRIERSGSRQHQVYEATGMEEDLAVEWSGPCEYRLSETHGDRAMRVKITRADSSGYDCSTVTVGFERVVYTLRLDRVQQ